MKRLAAFLILTSAVATSGCGMCEGGGLFGRRGYDPYPAYEYAPPYVQYPQGMCQPAPQQCAPACQPCATPGY